MTTQSISNNPVASFYAAWIEPAIEFVGSIIRSLSKGERVMLAAVLFAGAVGAFGTHDFFAESRGWLVGWFAALCIEATYLGSAGIAVKLPGQIWLSRSLAAIGALGSIFFNVLVSLRERVPGLFGMHLVNGKLVEGGAITWPSNDQLLVYGGLSLVEGAIIPLIALLGSLLLHSMASHRLLDADSQAEAVQRRKDAKPFGCPFCPASFDSAPKLYGHGPQCAGYKESELSTDEKKAIIKKAVEDGKQRILEG